jgi:iron-sulfur cluster assembly accessory protein
MTGYKRLTLTGIRASIRKIANSCPPRIPMVSPRIFLYNRVNMVQLTERAITKVKEILDSQEPKPAGLRISVVGGGCSGFSYSMAFENQQNMLDKTYKYEGLSVFIDQASLLYLDGAEVDYVESLEGAGFKFNNPNVKSTCGCGSSFSA